MLSQMFRLHMREITDFLNSIVIKFEPFIEILNSKFDYIGTIVDDDPTTYPYYRILLGDITFATKDIFVYLPDTQSNVLLSRDILDQYPNIRTFYDNITNFNTLLNRYPDDQFLIRRVFDPVINITEAINAPSLTVLSTINNDRYLNPYERDDLIIFLKDFLVRFDYRWYINVFEYEDLYPYAYWSMLWYTLPFILLTRRIINIKTDKVHPFHIWEYLTSVGFGSYRGYLSREQEMFLYRNNMFLKYNVGKRFILDILSKVFLKPIKYSLHEKVIVCHTDNRELTGDKYPDVLSISSGNIDYNSMITFDRFLSDIYDNQYDFRNDTEYHLSVTDKFIKAPTNVLHTKFIELIRNSSITELMVILRFILDAVVYRIYTNRLHYTVYIQSPIANVSTELSVLDSLNLLYYCLYKAAGIEPVNVFSKYTLSTTLCHDEKPIISNSMYIAENKYNINNYIDTDAILDNTPYTSNNLFSSVELSKQLGIQYVWLFELVSSLQLTYDYIEHEMLYTIYNTLVPETKVVDIYQPITSYDEFFTDHIDAKSVIDSISTNDDYVELIYTIFEGICPLAHGFSSLARDDENATVIIHKLKRLFTYLTSYNVTFITPTVDRQDYYETPRICAHVFPSELSTEIYTNEGACLNYDYSLSISTTGELLIESELASYITFDPSTTNMLIDIQNDDVTQSLIHSMLVDTTIYINGCGVEIEFDTYI